MYAHSVTSTNTRDVGPGKPAKLSRVGSSLGPQSLRMGCPNCDSRRSGPCHHHKTKARLHLAKLQRSVVRLTLDDNEDDYYDETPEFQIGYRRPELVDQTADVQDLSDEIKIRLLLARLRALEAYNKKWA